MYAEPSLLDSAREPRRRSRAPAPVGNGDAPLRRRRGLDAPAQPARRAVRARRGRACASSSARRAPTTAEPRSTGPATACSSRSRARDAVAAAAEIQRSLAAEPWPDDEAHRLRIGIHTGEPELGRGLRRHGRRVAARICASAHGEQVVVSQATRDMAGDEPLPGARSGRWAPPAEGRPGAVQLFQLVAPGPARGLPAAEDADGDEPAGAPPSTRRPRGRARACRGSPRREASRLVTITGPGGAGRAASRSRSRRSGRRPAGPPRRPRARLRRRARAERDRPRDRRARVRAAGACSSRWPTGSNGTGALLFLDNLEHLPGAGCTSPGCSTACPTSRCSRRAARRSASRPSTCSRSSRSRSRTRRRSSSSWRRPAACCSGRRARVGARDLPPPRRPAARDRARRARLAVLPPAGDPPRARRGARARDGGPVDLPERQRTLRAAIDWSYGRLSPSQRALTGRSPYSPTADRSTTRAIAGAGRTFLRDLEALVGWSLVRSESTDGELRLSMLETVREHALDHCARKDASTTATSVTPSASSRLALDAESAACRRGSGSGSIASSASSTTRRPPSIGSSRPAVSRMLFARWRAERFWRAHGHASEAPQVAWPGTRCRTECRGRARASPLGAARQATAQIDLAAAIPAPRGRGRDLSRVGSSS